MQCDAVCCSVLQCVAVCCSAFLPETMTRESQGVPWRESNLRSHASRALPRKSCHPTQEASWMQIIDPVYTHLFELYSWLRTKPLSDFHPFEWAGVDIRWFSVKGFDTCCVPKSFSYGRRLFEEKATCAPAQVVSQTPRKEPCIQKSPVYPQKHPIYPQKSHVLSPRSRASRATDSSKRALYTKEPCISTQEPYISAKEPCS